MALTTAPWISARDSRRTQPNKAVVTHWTHSLLPGLRRTALKVEIMLKPSPRVIAKTRLIAAPKSPQHRYVLDGQAASNTNTAASFAALWITENRHHRLLPIQRFVSVHEQPMPFVGVVGQDP